MRARRLRKRSGKLFVRNFSYTSTCVCASWSVVNNKKFWCCLMIALFLDSLHHFHFNCCLYRRHLWHVLCSCSNNWGLTNSLALECWKWWWLLYLEKLKLLLNSSIWTTFVSPAEGDENFTFLSLLFVFLIIAPCLKLESSVLWLVVVSRGKE